MSDEAGAQLDSYKQIDHANPTDGVKPSDGEQRIDLTEYYKETGQAEGTMMMQGFEEISLGRLSKRTAMLMKLQGAETFDPFPSERNTVAGQEGFFHSISEKFKEIIEGIIKYIKMAINWIIDTVKSFFGFRKSARITREIDGKLGDLKEQFEKTMLGLGFPVGQYNVENFLGTLPAGKNVKFQLLLLKSKFETDQESIDGITAALPLLAQAVGKLRQSNDKAMAATKALKKVINEEYTRTRVRKATNQRVDSQNSTEANRITKAIQEVKTALDTAPIVDILGKVFETLYKIKFTNEELSDGFDKVRTHLRNSIKTESVKIAPQDVSHLLTGIQYLNKRYLEISDNEVDLSSINWKALGDVVDKSDSDKIKAMADYYGYPALLANYQGMTVEVRNFVQYCFNVSNSLMTVQKQAENLVGWYNRTHTYFYAGVMEDLDTLIAMVEEAKSKGHSPLLNKHGLPQQLLFIKEADALSVMEKLSSNLNFAIENDVAGVKTSINNFSKQIGWGKQI